MPRRPFALIFVLAFAVGGAPQAGRAQEPPRFEGRVEVTEVLLDVVVTDRSGELVAGLDAEDFLIDDGGREVEPTAVSFYTTRYAQQEAPDAGAPRVDEIPASRYFIFFFHDQRRAATPGNQLLQRQLQASRRSREWLASEMGPSDWIAVVSYDVKLEVHQDFTQDREALLRAVGDATRGREPESVRSRAAYTEASLLRRLPSGVELRRRTTRIYDALRLLAEASGHIVGRKNLLLFSIGFGDVRRDGFVLPDRRYYPAMVEALNANNVAVYPIDLTQRGARHLQSDFLSTLADDTGGAYWQFFTSFLTPLRRVATEASGYYLLSYRAEHPAGESGYREVEVRMRDQRLRARSQKGYRYGAADG